MTPLEAMLKPQPERSAWGSSAPRDDSHLKSNQFSKVMSEGKAVSQGSRLLGGEGAVAAGAAEGATAGAAAGGLAELAPLLLL